VEIAANAGRLNVQLGGTTNLKKKSLFERYGYPGVKVNTHAFRHELNTRMHQAGLSQLLIDAFSGRTTMGSVYNHETIEERTQGVAAYHPKTKHSTAAQRLDKVKTNQPLNLADVRELREGEQDHIIHQTHLGVCVHNFASEPCPKMGACLDCGRLGCVKGDDVKLCNLREECDDLKRRLDKAMDAQSRGVFGASESAKKLSEKLFKCEVLIQTLENPEIENGAIVWNADNGWTLTKYSWLPGTYSTWQSNSCRAHSIPLVPRSMSPARMTTSASLTLGVKSANSLWRSESGCIRIGCSYCLW